MNLPTDEASLLSADDAKQILSPYLDRLGSCIKDAWNNWCQLRDQHSELAAPLSTRSRASIVNDFIWNAVKGQFSGMEKEGVYVVEKRGLRILCIANQLTLRFKKLDRQHQSRNIQTHQQMSFVRQIPLPGIPENTRLTIGYVLDRLQTGIAELAVALPLNRSVAWSFLMPEINTEVEVVPFVVPNQEATRTRRVKVKQNAQTKARAENE